MPKSRTKIVPPPATKDQLSIRIDLASGARIGPGKVAVLEEIARTGSISAAGRALAISYRRTWLLVDSMNRCWDSPLVEAVAGGGQAKGARLTAWWTLRPAAAVAAEPA